MERAVAVLLLAALLAAPAVAHDDLTAWTPGEALDLDLPSGTNADTVSGVYEGDATYLLDAGSPPGGVAAGQGPFCDFEVVSEGAGPDPQDEPEVDGNANPASARGTGYNDGGFGGACHTHRGHYEEDAYNTPGCGYTPAYAEDASGLDVWITTQCSYGSRVVTHLTYFVQACIAELVANAVAGAGCALDLAGCYAPVPGTDCPMDLGHTCGPDEVGNSAVTLVQSGWGSQGAPFSQVPSPCADADGAASVLVWTAAFVDPLGSGVAVSEPTVGIIHQ